MRKLLVLAATGLVALSLGGCAASDVAGEVTGSTCITDTFGSELCGEEAVAFCKDLLREQDALRRAGEERGEEDRLSTRNCRDLLRAAGE